MCSTTVVAAGAALFVPAAYAAGVTLAFGPTATTATVVNLDPTASANNAATTYGLKITGTTASDPDPLRLSVLTGPSGGAVQYQRRSGNGTPTNTSGTVYATTALTGVQNTGDTVLNVTTGTGTNFTVGHWIAVTGATAGTTEFAVVSAVAANTVTITSGLVNGHVATQAVYDLGATQASTTLNADPAASATTLTLTSSAGFNVGDWASIGGDTAAHGELRRVVTVPGGTSITVAAISATDGNHAGTEAVVDLGAGTGISTASVVGDTSLTVASSLGLSVGDRLVVGGTTSETVTVSAVPNSTTITLESPLAYAHALYAPVVGLHTGTPANGFAPVPVGYSRQVFGYNTSTNSDNVFLGATAPGTYTLQFFKDRNGNTAYDSAQDDASPVFTLCVKDVNNTTSSDATDDLVPVVTAPTTVVQGLTITTTVDPGLTTVDTRGLDGLSPSVGILGKAIATKSNTAFSGPTGIGAGGAPTFNGSILTRTSATITGTGTATSTYTIGSAISTVATTNVGSNNVTAVDFTVPTVTGTTAVQESNVLTGGAAVIAVDGHAGSADRDLIATDTTIHTTAASGTDITGHRIKISHSGDTTEYATVLSGGGGRTLTLASPLVYAHNKDSALKDESAVAVKTGTAAVKYSATVLDSDTDKSGNVVYFTLGGTDVASLTTDGTTVDSGNHIYSATTDAHGVACLTVTDGASTRAAYTVLAASNNITGGTLTTTYADAAGKTLSITNSNASLSPAVGTANVTVTGKIVDQFGALFQPALSATQQVTVSNAIAGFATLSGGQFSYVYTPASTPTAGTSQTLTFTYPVGTSPAANAVVNWASAAAAGTVTITSPTDASTGLDLSDSTAIRPNTITGSVVSATNAALAFKTVTLSAPADSGVMFAADNIGTDMANPLSVAANSSGVFTVYAYFLHTGSTKIKATADAAFGEVGVTTDDSTDPYKIVVMSAAGMPGSTLVVTGKVTDLFDNPVPNRYVDLSAGATTIGSLTSGRPETNSDGVFATTFTTGSNQSGEATLTATLLNPGTASGDAKRTTDQTPITAWSTIAGMTVPNGSHVDTAKLTVDANVNKTVITQPAAHMGAGSVKLMGKAAPGGSVEIYSKLTGSTMAYALVGVATADGNGDWSDTEYIARTTTFYAKTSTSSSAPITVTVTIVPAPVVKKIGAKALGKGKVSLSVTGNGNAMSSVVVYRLSGKKWVKVGTLKVSAKGVASGTVTLVKGTVTVRLVYVNGNKTLAKNIKVAVK